MRRKRLFWKIYPVLLLFMFFLVAVMAWNTMRVLREFDRQHTAVELETRARLALQQISPPFHQGNYARVDALCKELGHLTATRYTIVLPSGKVVGDSEADPAHMENHGKRPEIILALATGLGVATRYSATLHEEMMYTAIKIPSLPSPLPKKRGVRSEAGIIRASLPLTAIDDALYNFIRELLWFAALIILLSVGITMLISRSISRPIEELKSGAMQLARGNMGTGYAFLPGSSPTQSCTELLRNTLTCPHNSPPAGSLNIPPQEVEELHLLAVAMNQMAAQMEERIRSAIRDRNEQDTVLMSMLEGVLALDNQERILKINHAAAMLFGIEQEQAEGRTIQEAIRNSDLQSFVTRVLTSQANQESEIILWDHEERNIQLHGTLLRDENGQRVGVVVVMNDVTRLRRLERVRRDFVANVSHELKTPITSIKGFAETLIEHYSKKSDDARQFLDIILTHADRLNAIIEDLLTLSRIEQQNEQSNIPLENVNVPDVIHSAMRTCAPKAEERQMTLAYAGPDQLETTANATLLEQAIVNLLDNAMKYSEPARSVHVALQVNEAELAISIHDRGYGIAREHLPRLFERFYRVDTGRSRKLGGTGLGLAIVKHIAQAHKGNVTVESTVGEGSTFTIHLPYQSY